MGTVFISYRHESAEHRDRVADFGQQLRDAGIDVTLDRFFEQAHPGGPDEGWDKWSANQVKNADRILMVGSPGWFRCFEGNEEPDRGFGAACEARLIFTQLYEKKWVSGVHRIVVLDDLGSDRIPLDLRPFPRFYPQREVADFDRLVRWIRGDAAKTARTMDSVEWPEPLADFSPDFADREVDEWPSLVKMLTGQSEERILLFEGPTNHGKSVLVRDCQRYAREAGIVVARVDFKGGVIGNVRDVLAELSLSLGEYLPRFAAGGGKDTFELRQDLRGSRLPLLVIFDTYEVAVSNRDVTAWLENQFLGEVEHVPGLAVIVAGQKVPDHANAAWKSRARAFHLGPIVQPEPWRSWIKRHCPAVWKQIDSGLLTVDAIIHGNRGVPGTISGFCDNLEKASGSLPEKAAS